MFWTGVRFPSGPPNKPIGVIMYNKEIEVIISDELKKELASLGIDADKEIQQGIQMGLSDGPDLVSTGQMSKELENR
jgi:hypothetical protein